MAKPTSTFVAQPVAESSFSAGAAQAEDYEEEVLTKTHGSRPRRSEIATAAQPEHEQVAPVVPAEPSSANAKDDLAPESPAPLDSALFVGGLTASGEKTR